MRIPCHIIQDLLPNYIDNCTSEKTNQDIQEHLSQCSSCQKLYEEMKKPIPIKENHDIDYLKHIKNNQLLKIILTIVISCIIFISIILMKNYVLGYYTENIYTNHLSIQNETIKINVSSLSHNETLIDYHYETDQQNKQIITFQSVKSSFLHSSKQTEFKIPLSKVKNYLIIGNKVVSNTGQIYDKDVIDIIDASIPYVGDASGVGNLLGLVNMQEEGDYHLSLQTSKEPYSIKIIFHTPLSSSQKERVIKKCQMILACIDNCDTIYFESKSHIEKVTYTKNIRSYDDMQTLKDS